MRMHRPIHASVILINPPMQGQGLGRPSAGHMIPLQIDPAYIVRIEPSKRSIGRRNEPAIIEPRTDISRTANRIRS